MRAITKTVTILHLLAEMDARYRFLCMYQDNTKWGNDITRKNIDDLFLLSNLFRAISEIMVKDGKTFHQVNLYELFSDFKAYFIKQFEADTRSGLMYMDDDDIYKLVFFLLFIDEMFVLLGNSDNYWTKTFHATSQKVIEFIDNEVKGIAQLSPQELFARGYLGE